MNRRFQRGLVVGKFCPLHMGHESVIRRAIERCEEVFVISYTNPEFPGCAPPQRRAWLAARFPGVHSLVLDSSPGISIPPNDASDTTHRRFVARLCTDLLRVEVDAVFTSESYGDGFAGELSICFRGNDPGHRGVAHVLVDQARDEWPVSGTILRRDVHGHRQFLAPEVYADFVERVALLGGESSGKSTLAAALAGRFGTVWVPEYGRELWESRGGVLHARDMPEIARTQLKREKLAAANANRFLFCDTTPLTTLFYSEEMFGRADPEVTAAALRHDYAHTIVCAPDFPFVQDGTRRDDGFRLRQHEWYLGQLANRGISSFVVSGSLDQRMDTVSACLTGTVQR